MNYQNLIKKCRYRAKTDNKCYDSFGISTNDNIYWCLLDKKYINEEQPYYSIIECSKQNCSRIKVKKGKI